MTAAELSPLLAFAAAVGVLTITPGVDTAIVLRASAASGPRAGAAAGLGVCAGLFVWGAGGGVRARRADGGIAARPSRRSNGAGAAYLVALGLQLILRPRTRLRRGRPRRAPLGAFRRGFLTNS